MPISADTIYRTKAQVVANMITAIMSQIADVHVEEDGNVRIAFEVVAGEIEGVYLANQIVRDNIFVQSANFTELRRHGEEYGVLVKVGTPATGTVKFSGAGGTFVGAGAEIASDSGAGDLLYYLTTADATLPNPGSPTAPTAADGGAVTNATSLLDQFNRANENPIAGPGWVNTLYPSSDAGLKIVSNQVTVVSTSGGAYWGTHTYTDCEAYATVAVLPTAASACRVYARITNPISSSLDGYFIRMEAGASAGMHKAQIWKVTNTGETKLAEALNVSFVAGDSMKIVCLGSTLEFWRFIVATGTWVRLVSVIDTTYAGAGYIGLRLGDSTVRVDDFGGGALALGAGTYEYAVTFVTAGGETIAGAESVDLAISVLHEIGLTGIPLGGPGTTARNIYRQVDGGGFKFAAQIADNTTTTFTDYIPDGSLTNAPLTESTAESVTTAAESEASGVQYNAVIGAIDELIDVPDGITDVTNTVVFTGGTDTEDMEVFRARLLKFLRNPQTGSPADLESWAKEIAGVEEATAFENDNVGTPANGHTTVRITGPAGTVPGAPVIAAVLAALELKDIANITLHVTTFTAVSTDVTVDVTTSGTYVLGDVTEAVQTAVTNYINSIPVGGTVYKAGIIDSVFGLAGIANVTTTFTDTTHTATEKAVAGTVTVS